MDKGPFRVKVTKFKSGMCGPENDVRLNSDDFTHDASLIVYGDFKNLATKRRYADYICKLLNGALMENEYKDDMK